MIKKEYIRQCTCQWSIYCLSPSKALFNIPNICSMAMEFLQVFKLSPVLRILGRGHCRDCRWERPLWFLAGQRLTLWVRTASGALLVQNKIPSQTCSPGRARTFLQWLVQTMAWGVREVLPLQASSPAPACSEGHLLWRATGFPGHAHTTRCWLPAPHLQLQTTFVWVNQWTFQWPNHLFQGGPNTPTRQSLFFHGYSTSALGCLIESRTSYT